MHNMNLEDTSGTRWVFSDGRWVFNDSPVPQNWLATYCDWNNYLNFTVCANMASYTHRVSTAILLALCHYM